MARYTGPNNKKARRVGFSILENGKDLKRPFGPGQHGNDRKKKPSNYSVQLTEKQKVRFMYGISEKQFKKLVGLDNVELEITDEAVLAGHRRHAPLDFKTGRTVSPFPRERETSAACRIRLPDGAGDPLAIAPFVLRATAPHEL